MHLYISSSQCWEGKCKYTYNCHVKLCKCKLLIHILSIFFIYNHRVPCKDIWQGKCKQSRFQKRKKNSNPHVSDLIIYSQSIHFPLFFSPLNSLLFHPSQFVKTFLTHLLILFISWFFFVFLLCQLTKMVASYWLFYFVCVRHFYRGQNDRL